VGATVAGYREAGGDGDVADFDFMLARGISCRLGLRCAGGTNDGGRESERAAELQGWLTVSLRRYIIVQLREHWLRKRAHQKHNHEG
jgi:hypothetical protein